MKIDEKLHCKDCDWFRSCEYYSRRKETSQICKNFQNQWKMIEELEKIKTEINGFCKGYLCTPQPEVIADDINEHIINKKIAELKGE